jgi:competence protein ComFC
MTLRRFAHLAYTECIRFLFPPQCPGCGKSDTYICTTCQESIIPTPTPIPDKNITALFRYRASPIVKRMLWLLKYRNKYAVADILGRYVSEVIVACVAKDEVFRDATVWVVAMPMSPKNMKLRGKNHARLIAEVIVRTIPTLTLADEHVLKKVKETRRQATIHKKSARLKNLVGSMRACDVAGKTIILIDDVTTTGASIIEARRALMEAGAKSVTAYVIAH